MNIELDKNLARGYHSSSQIARVLTETWTKENMFCPRCGNNFLERFDNNKPVADFYCPVCRNQYELKSRNGKIGKKIADGSYDKMISRITSNTNPDFFFMSYSLKDYKVLSFSMVPKFFFHPDVIEKRVPLSIEAQRANWVGCNILLHNIPRQGIINIISDSVIRSPESVLLDVSRIRKLEVKNMDSRGWLFDILECVNKIPETQFTLVDVYNYQNMLHLRHPQNNNIQAKIRQQLQLLRDKGVIEFLGDGNYRKVI